MMGVRQQCVISRQLALEKAAVFLARSNMIF